MDYLTKKRFLWEKQEGGYTSYSAAIKEIYEKEQEKFWKHKEEQMQKGKGGFDLGLVNKTGTDKGENYGTNQK